jgi:hypothetical protein
MKTFIILLFTLVSVSTFAQTSGVSREKIPFSTHEISLNGFRNPSVGLEYRYKRFSVHAGYYPTIISTNEQGESETTSFIRTGISYWFLPVYSTRHAPSSFYVSASYVRGLDQDWENKNGLLTEVGFKWVVWKGLNLRFGAAMLAGPGQKVKINPTPGISYSIFLK